MEQTVSFTDAIGLLPAWIQIWINVLFFGAYILPLSLLIWRSTRWAALITVLASVIGAVTTRMLYDAMGFVKVLGLPHIIVWVPIVILLSRVYQRDDVPVWPKRIILVILGVICISLVFDTVDVARYLLGERTPSI